MLAKVWKKLTSREELVTNSGEELVVEIDGQERPLADVLASAHTNKKKNEDEEKDEKDEKKDAKCNGEDKVDVDGEEMSVNELIKKYKAAKKASKNADDEEKDEEKDEKKDNAEDEKKEEKDEKKENAIDGETKERFDNLNDAHENGAGYELETSFLSLNDRLIMAQKKYGTQK